MDNVEPFFPSLKCMHYVFQILAYKPNMSVKIIFLKHESQADNLHKSPGKLASLLFGGNCVNFAANTNLLAELAQHPAPLITFPVLSEIQVTLQFEKDREQRINRSLEEFFFLLNQVYNMSLYKDIQETLYHFLSRESSTICEF